MPWTACDKERAEYVRSTYSPQEADEACDASTAWTACDKEHAEYVRSTYSPQEADEACDANAVDGV